MCSTGQGLVDPHTDVTNDDHIMTGKIALAHLNEFPDYYTRLEKNGKKSRRKIDLLKNIS